MKTYLNKYAEQYTSQFKDKLAYSHYVLFATRESDNRFWSDVFLSKEQSLCAFKYPPFDGYQDCVELYQIIPNDSGFGASYKPVKTFYKPVKTFTHK